MSKAIALSLYVIIILYSFSTAAIINVPADYPSIQTGIDTTVEGDTVMIAPGTYSGEGNRYITTSGKAITVMGELGALHTIIDCAPNYDGFIIANSEGSGTIITGLTIINAIQGIFCDGTSPQINSCIFNNFFAYGIHIDGYTGDPPVTPVIENCIFEQQNEDYFGWGDGIYGYRQALITVSDCKFARCQHGMNYHAYSNLLPQFDISNCMFRDIEGNGIWTHS